MCQRNCSWPTIAIALILMTTSVLIAPLLAKLAPVPANPASKPTRPVISKGLTIARLKERGAFLSDDFEGKEINKNRWYIWTTNADKVQLYVKNGRFVIEGHGKLSHNGLSSVPHVKYKDVVLVGRMDIKSQGLDHAWCVLHLCGVSREHGPFSSPKLSPDHSVEITMEDRGDQALFSIVAWLPRGAYKSSYPELLLPRTESQGFLAKLELDAGNNLCTPWVYDGKSWRQLDDPIELLVRTIHCEIKVLHREAPGLLWTPSGSENAQTTAWFDDVRIYPRPRTHPVMVRLVLKDGSSPLFRTATGTVIWPPKFQVAGGPERSVEDIVVQLWTADGKRRISSVQSQLEGWYLLPLKDAPWDLYPQGARIRLLLDGKVWGQEVEIPVRGLDGLYPDDVWDLVLE